MRNRVRRDSRQPVRFGRGVAGVLAAGLVAATLVGCATQEKYNLDPAVQGDSSDAFDLGADLPPTPKTLLALGRLLAQQGKDDQSRFVLIRATVDYPQYTPAYSELAENYMRGGRLEDARRTLDNGLHHAPNDPVLLNNLGMCWMLDEDNEKALDAFTKAAAAMPQDARYRANKAVALGMLGRYHECLSTYKEVMPSALAHYNLAVICEARDDRERAALEYKVARELEPGLFR